MSYMPTVPFVKVQLKVLQNSNHFCNTETLWLKKCFFFVWQFNQRVCSLAFLFSAENTWKMDSSVWYNLLTKQTWVWQCRSKNIVQIIKTRLNLPLSQILFLQNNSNKAVKKIKVSSIPTTNLKHSNIIFFIVLKYLNWIAQIAQMWNAQVSVRQFADICLFSTAQYKCTVDEKVCCSVRNI